MLWSHLSESFYLMILIFFLYYSSLFPVIVLVDHCLIWVIFLLVSVVELASFLSLLHISSWLLNTVLSFSNQLTVFLFCLFFLTLPVSSLFCIIWKMSLQGWADIIKITLKTPCRLFFFLFFFSILVNSRRQIRTEI